MPQVIKFQGSIKLIKPLSKTGISSSNSRWRLTIDVQEEWLKIIKPLFPLQDDGVERDIFLAIEDGDE